MKVTNVNDPGERAHGIVRGHTGTRRAGSTGITIYAGNGSFLGITGITVMGGTVTDNGDGTVTITIGGGGGDPGGNFVLATGGGGHVIYTNDNAGPALTLDMSLATVYDITLTEDCTLAFINAPIDGEAHIWIFVIRQGGVGGWTVTWPAAVQWQDTDGTSGGVAPTLYTAAGAEDVFQVSTLDDGTTYGGGQERAGSGGSSAGDAFVWRPLIDTGSGAVIFDAGTGNAVMAFTAI